jgi:hypothetical protein
LLLIVASKFLVLLIFQVKGTLVAGGAKWLSGGTKGAGMGFTPSLVEKLKKPREAP